MKKIIIGILAIVILGVGFAGYWFNRPIAKANKAIENNEIEKVAEYYFKCNDEQQDSISEQMRHYCQDLSSSYINGDAEYEYVKGQFDLLADDILSDDSVFTNIVASTELLHDSREAYKNATAAFEAKDYEKALAEYQKIIADDEHGDEIAQNIEICKKELLPDFIGLWENTSDIGPVLASLAGLAGNEHFKFELTSYYEFREDGTGIRYADEEQIKTGLVGYLDSSIDAVVELYEHEYGISREKLDKEFKKLYGMNIRDYVMKNSDIDGALASVNATTEEFKYTVEDTSIKVTDDSGKEYIFRREGNELLLDANITDENQRTLERFGFEYPLHFTKSN